MSLENDYQVYLHGRFDVHMEAQTSKINILFPLLGVLQTLKRSLGTKTRSCK